MKGIAYAMYFNISHFFSVFCLDLCLQVYFSHFDLLKLQAIYHGPVTSYVLNALYFQKSVIFSRSLIKKLENKWTLF